MQGMEARLHFCSACLPGGLPGCGTNIQTKPVVANLQGRGETASVTTLGSGAQGM